MAKVTREHFEIAFQQKKGISDIAIECGVTKQAVIHMRKKYYPQGWPPEPIEK
jgi:hypothetical protein